MASNTLTSIILILFIFTSVTSACHGNHACSRRKRDTGHGSEDCKAGEFMKKLIIKFKNYREKIYAECVKAAVEIVKHNSPQIIDEINNDEVLKKRHKPNFMDNWMDRRQISQSKTCQKEWFFCSFISKCMRSPITYLGDVIEDEKTPSPTRHTSPGKENGRDGTPGQDGGNSNNEQGHPSQEAEDSNPGGEQPTAGSTPKQRKAVDFSEVNSPLIRDRIPYRGSDSSSSGYYYRRRNVINSDSDSSSFDQRPIIRGVYSSSFSSS